MEREQSSKTVIENFKNRKKQRVIMKRGGLILSEFNLNLFLNEELIKKPFERIITQSDIFKSGTCPRCNEFNYSKNQYNIEIKDIDFTKVTLFYNDTDCIIYDKNDFDYNEQSLHEKLQEISSTKLYMITGYTSFNEEKDFETCMDFVNYINQYVKKFREPDKKEFECILEYLNCPYSIDIGIELLFTSNFLSYLDEIPLERLVESPYYYIIRSLKTKK